MICRHQALALAVLFVSLAGTSSLAQKVDEASLRSATVEYGRCEDMRWSGVAAAEACMAAMNQHHVIYDATEAVMAVKVYACLLDSSSRSVRFLAVRQLESNRLRRSWSNGRHAPGLFSCLQRVFPADEALPGFAKGFGVKLFSLAAHQAGQEDEIWQRLKYLPPATRLTYTVRAAMYSGDLRRFEAALHDFKVLSREQLVGPLGETQHGPLSPGQHSALCLTLPDYVAARDHQIANVAAKVAYSRCGDKATDWVMSAITRCVKDKKCTGNIVELTPSLDKKDRGPKSPFTRLLSRIVRTPRLTGWVRGDSLLRLHRRRPAHAKALARQLVNGSDRELRCFAREVLGLRPGRRCRIDSPRGRR